MKEIPEIKLIPVPETEEAKAAVGYQWNAIAGTRHKLGGQPDSTSEIDYPKCEDCSQVMTFYAQIDSIGDDYDLLDCGVIHVFVCLDCGTTNSMINQCPA
ncbi:hypothetical protein H8B15_20185 [Hymenobacter sp. BT507]|uniref:DUF1963 domain-containing protein n=1 Tax=Hymenobacter citatus TaxID=2763506 RepID=A0ABR7MQB3_9BACT|nr:hypothetical protein [Hymenobacter citatus]MBC6613252.1 hypothetical protein [Hymenobacter citatus]